MHICTITVDYQKNIHIYMYMYMLGRAFTWSNTSLYIIEHKSIQPVLLTFISDAIIVMAAEEVKPLMTGNDINSTRNPMA